MAQQQEYDENGNPIYSATTNSPNTGVNGPPAPTPVQKTPFDHSTFRDAWLGTGNDVGAQNTILGNYGITTAANGDAIMPDGSVMDLRRGAKAGDNTAQWMGKGQMVNGAFQPYPAASGGEALGHGVMVNNGASGTSSGAKWDALYGELMNRAHQGLNVDPNNPVIKGQTDAFNATQERARRTYLQQQAEQGSPYATGMMGGQERMSAEKAGQATAGFQSELMGREVQAKRDEIAQALSGAQGMLSQEQQMALQKELALMDNEIKRQQLGQQQSQFNDTLDFNKNDRSTYWDWTKQGGKTN